MSSSEIKLKSRPNGAAERFYEAPPTAEYSQMIGGWLRTWKEYVPSCYDGSRPVPLVLSVHGAAHHHADRNTAWQLVAERENFIVVYPHCLIEGIKFNSWNDYGPDDRMPDDVEYFDRLIDIICEKYNIDTERIYIQGQSVGDTMASTYVFERGERIAAAALLSGPQGTARFVSAETGEIIRRPHCAVPVIRTHGSEDTVPLIGSVGKICVFGLRAPDVEDYSDEGRRAKWLLNIQVHNHLWREANGCAAEPRIGVRGRYNWLVYDGSPADYVFYIVEGGEHGPYLDMADNIWRFFFSHYRRVNGETERVESPWNIEPDCGAIALADGAALAYVDNRPVQLDGDGRTARAVNGSFYVPAGFLERAFPGARVTGEQEGTAARLVTQDGHSLYLAAGNRVAVCDNTLREMPSPQVFDGCLYVAISEIAALVSGLHSAEGHGVCYLGPHEGLMSYDLAYAIKLLLGAEKEVPLQECAAMELELLRAREASGEEKYEGGEAKVFDGLFAKYLESVEAYRASQEDER